MCRYLKKCAAPAVGLFFFLLDVGTDISLIDKYKRENSVYFTPTLVFVVLPALITVFMDIAWVVRDYELCVFKRQSPVAKDSSNGQSTNETVELVIPSDQETKPLSVSAGGTLDETVDEDNHERNHSDTQIDERINSSNTRSWSPKEKKLATIHIVVSIISGGVLGRVWRIMEFTMQYIKTVRIEDQTDGRRIHFKESARQREKDCFTLSLIEAFWESAPQLALQLYIFFKKCDLDVVRIVSILASIASIAITYALYYRGNRTAASNHVDVSWIHWVFVYIPSVIASVTVRVSCFVYAAVSVHFLLPVILGIVHIVGCFLWMCLKKPNLDGMLLSNSEFSCHKMCKFFRCCERLSYYIWYTLIMLILFFNVQKDPKEGQVGRQQCLFYVIVNVENVLLIIFIIVCGASVENCAIGKYCVTIVACVCIVVHALLLSFFYKCCHPTHSRRNPGCFVPQDDSPP